MVIAPIAVTGYVAKSSPDERGSLEDQAARIRERVAELGGRTIVGEFAEQDVSAYHGNRGPQLEAAMACAIQHAPSELWVFHSSRLARGSGRKAEGRSLLRIYVDLLEQDVTIRSVENDGAFQHGAMVAIQGDTDHQFSAALSSHVKRGKRVAAEAGKWPGGVAPDGYRREEYIDDADGRARHRMVIDDAREPVIRRIFQMALDGHSAHVISRQLNREGVKTRPSSQYPSGKLWTNQRVRRLLGNPAYAGRLEIKRGQPDAPPPSRGDWPAFVTEEEFDSLHVPGRRRHYGAGRPPTRSKLALYKLACCAGCGGPMYARVSQFTRADGTRQRYYHCANRHKGVCEAPRVDAALVDNAIVEHLDKLFVDIEAWQTELAAVIDDQHTTLERELKAVHAALAKLQSQEEKVRSVWTEALEADDPRADAREDAYIALRAKRAVAEESVKATESRLSQVPTEPPSDEMLDLYSELARVVRSGGGDLAGDLNDRLRLVFSDFLIERTEAGILIQPLLREDTVERYGNPSGWIRVTAEDESVWWADPQNRDGALVLPGTGGSAGDERARRPPATAITIGTDSLSWARRYRGETTPAGADEVVERRPSRGTPPSCTWPRLLQARTQKRPAGPCRAAAAAA